MSDNELSRYHELQKVHERRQTIAQAAMSLGLSTRQVKRLSKRLKTEGKAGLVSRKIGKPGNHQLPEGLKKLALGLIQDHYLDFGPTLAHEYLLEKHNLPLSVSTVRNIMIESQIWLSKARRRRRVFQLRPRRAREGELIQLDGSEHQWFEERGPYCTLLSFIDDATSKIMFLRFVKSENLIDYFAAMRGYIGKHGRPQTLYPDKHSVFRVNREGALSGTGMTQFGRAMQELDIQLICANTPQAKGRVERRHRDLQDRLIKAMRLQKIATLEEANAFLPSFINDFNRRFGKPPQDATNAHRPLLSTQNLDRIFCQKAFRRLCKSLTLQYNNVTYQIISDRPLYAMRNAAVEVLESEDGTIRIEYQGKALRAVPYHQMQARTEVVSSKELSIRLSEKPRYRPKPGRHHPWKRGRRGFSKRALTHASCC
jgi:hypothetical protein